MDLSQLITEQYAEFEKYIPSPFTDSVSARFDSFVKSLSGDQARFLKEIYDFKDNINVLTANTNGVTAWEAFLELPDRPDLSLQARRGRLFSRMNVKASTMKSIKDVVNSYIGSDAFEIFEYYTLSDPVSAFWYEVRIGTPYTAPFVRADLEFDLQRLQPAHCRLVAILDYVKYLADTQTTSDEISSEILSIFISDISLSDGPDLVA